METIKFHNLSGPLKWAAVLAWISGCLLAFSFILGWLEGIIYA